MTKPFNFNNLNDYELEYLKEISGQVGGYIPSEMWGRLTREKPIVDKKHYETLMNVSNQAELQKHATTLGGGFKKAIKHILGIGSKVANISSKGANYLSRHPELYKNLPYVGQVDPGTIKNVGNVLKGSHDVMKSVNNEIHLKPKEIPKTQVQVVNNTPISSSNYKGGAMVTGAAMITGGFNKFGKSRHNLNA